MSVLRSCIGPIWVGLLFTIVLLAGCAFGQDSPSAPVSTPPSTPTAPVPPPADLKHTDLTPIELKPDASGVVPAEQIRELLLRAEAKELENEKRQRDYTFTSAKKSTSSMGMAG